MKAARFTTALLALTPVASAFPSWPRWLPDIDTLIVRRADTTTTAASAAATTAATTDAADATNLNTAGLTSTATADTTTGTNTGTTTGTTTDNTSGTATDDASGTATGTGTGTDTTSNSKTSSVSVSSDAPAGSAVVITPVTTLTSAYYRIGEYVTMKWNYTDLEVEPTAVDVLISCTTASETWTLTNNMTFTTRGAFTWDTGAYQESAIAQPLVVEEYILYIVDADSSISATAGAGSLTANAAVTFGLYTGQPYTPISSGWVCATCSGAMSSAERQALGFLFTVTAITVASFTWFVTGLW